MFAPDQELFEVTLPRKVSFTLTVPKDSLSKTSGDLPDGYSFCGARTFNLLDKLTSETLNLATSELVTFVDGVLTFNLIESGTYSFEMFYALDGLPLVKTAPRTVTITVLSARTVSPFKFVGASPGFQYLVEEESVLELNFELENTELNDFTIDL